MCICWDNVCGKVLLTYLCDKVPDIMCVVKCKVFEVCGMDVFVLCVIFSNLLEFENGLPHFGLCLHP